MQPEAPAVALLLVIAASLSLSPASADVPSEYAALHSLVNTAGCLPYFATYFGWSTALLEPGTAATAICPLTNGDATKGFECDEEQEHIVSIFVIGKNSPQLSGYNDSTCDFSLVNPLLDWSTTFPELTELEWSYTRTSGPVPQVLLTPPALLVLDLKRNAFTGTLSQLDFATAPNLEQLDVSHNLIAGTVPASLAADSFATVVELGYNQLTGTLPMAFASDAELVTFGVAANLLTGPVPNFGAESVFEFLDVSANRFTGTIPEYVGSFGAGGTGLLTLLLQGNQLTGSIPAAVSQLTHLDTIWMGGNRLTGSVPDLSALTNLGQAADSEGADFAGGNLFACPIPDPALAVYDTMNCSCGAGSVCTGSATTLPGLCDFPAPAGGYTCARDPDSGVLPVLCQNSARFHCDACAAGEYSAVAFLTSCEDCAAGRFSEEQASACTDCAPGLYNTAPAQTACAECAEGQFQREAAATDCSDCDAGRYHIGTGASACTLCSAGQFSSTPASTACEDCVPGRASDAGHSECTNCVAGSFAYSSGTSRCALCQRGRAAAGAGSGDSGGVGSGNVTGATVCEACAAGYFFAEQGGTACFECSAGQFSSMGGASACHGSCSPGYFAPSASSRCTACGVGTASATANAGAASECAGCAPGRFANTTGQSDCALCPSGRYAEAEAHSQCLACNLKTEFEFGSTSCLFFDTASIVIVAAVALVVVGIVATISYFVCCVATRKRKETADHVAREGQGGGDVVFGGGGHTQRLQVSDGSRLESPRRLPAGHAYRRDSSDDATAESPAFEMAQRRHPTAAQAELAQQQREAEAAQKAEYRRQQQHQQAQAQTAVAAVSAPQPYAAAPRQAGADADAGPPVVSDDRRTLLYDFVAAADDPSQLSTGAGQLVDVLEIFEDGWLRVRRSDGAVGLVPEAYCE